MDQLKKNEDKEFLLALLAKGLWKGRGLVFAYMLSGLCISALYLAVLATPLFRASATISPISSGSNINDARGALAAVAGINLGNGTSVDFTEFLQVMHSARLADRLAHDYGLDKELLPGWNAARKQWLQPDEQVGPLISSIKRSLSLPQWSPPTSSRFADYLSKSVIITPLSTTGGSLLRSQLYDVNFDYKNRDVALRVLFLVISETDTLIREDHLANTSNRVFYLQKMLKETTEIPLRDGLQTLLTGEQQTLMSERADKYFSVSVIDPPHADNMAFSPRGLLIVISSLCIGFLIGIANIVYLLWRRFMLDGNDIAQALNRPFQNPFSSTVKYFYGLALRANRLKFNI